MIEATPEDRAQDLETAMREAINLLEKSAKESRAADRMIYAHRAKVVLKKALGEH